MGQCNAGAFIEAKGGISKAIDEKHAEAVEVLEALTWAKGKNIENLVLEGDSLNVVNAINGVVGKINWTINSVVQDCTSILRTFSSWSCCYVKREANQVVDSLAKKSRTNNMSLYYDYPPEFY